MSLTQAHINAANAIKQDAKFTALQEGIEWRDQLPVTFDTIMASAGLEQDGDLAVAFDVPEDPGHNKKTLTLKIPGTKAEFLISPSGDSSNGFVIKAVNAEGTGSTRIENPFFQKGSNGEKLRAIDLLAVECYIDWARENCPEGKAGELDRLLNKAREFAGAHDRQRQMSHVAMPAFAPVPKNA